MNEPTSDELCFLPAIELRRLIAGGDLSPVELVEAHLRRIEARNPALGAYVALMPERARDRARAAERAMAAGRDTGPLHGLPVAVKDEDEGEIAGMPLTLGLRQLATHRAKQDSVIVERLQGAGAIILGKTNLPELGHKGTTDNLLFGPTSTPFCPGRNAGGSSGGSAAAVADGLAVAAQGSDGGGSIRIPAALSGCYGLKPSFGRVPFAARPDAFYHTPFSSAGPLTRCVEDAGLMLDVMAGPDDRDPFCLPSSGGSFQAAAANGIRGTRIAYSPDLGTFPVSAEVREVVGAAVSGFAEAGARVEPIEVDLGYSHDRLSDLWKSQIALTFACTERALRADGSDLLGGDSDLPSAVIDYIERGRTSSAIGYKAGDLVRSVVFDAFRDVFERYDFLVTPTTCVSSVPNDGNGETVGPSEVDGVPVDPLIGWCLTFPVNFTGHPAASVPAGMTAKGIPVGLQIVGPRFGDAAVLAASAAFEQARPWQSMYARLRLPREQKGFHVV